MYQFSIPMPINKLLIDKVIDLNKKVQLSKISNFYFALPFDCEKSSGFENARYPFKMETDYNYWKDLISYSIDNGFSFTYLINSHMPFFATLDDLNKKFERLDILLNDLSKIGVNQLRIGNMPLLQYVIKNYPNYRVLSSTLFEYTQLGQYRNFAFLFPEVKEIVPSYEVNRNFKLLKNLKKYLPNQEIEIMVNENCTSGCPMRIAHAINLAGDLLPENIIRKSFYFDKCSEMMNKNPFLYACKTRSILPWDIQEYSKIGINRFKVVGRDRLGYMDGSFLTYCSIYLQGIEDYKSIADYNYDSLIYIPEIKGKNIRIKDLRYKLPQINHFKKYGHLCSSECGSECVYCYKCAKEIEKVFK